MSRTTIRPSQARKQAAAPFSTAAAKLIEQIQAEARAQLLAELSAKDTITVLHGFDAETKTIYAGNTRIEITDAKGNAVFIRRHHTEPDVWRDSPHMAGYWHPARWYGDQTFVDINGAQWERKLHPMVCNDFGNLVEVAA